MTSVTDIAGFASIRDVFALQGDDMRTHRGRSVVALTIDGRRHFLKRFWLDPAKPFARSVSRGLHELRMIDWLNDNGFAGPKIVRRGSSSLGPLRTRVFFLMEEVADEAPLETTWRQLSDKRTTLIDELATFAARLHDARFVHTDFSERHIFVGRSEGAWSFRLIDVERAIVGRMRESRAAADLATLTASVVDRELAEAVRTKFVDRYLATRTTLEDGVDFRALLSRARPTKSF
ncbi:MAG: hypothetical protein IID35_03845 [Planctomycetes bacterium]|nr:hypothetical protein [Planctomycetota bacterium]